MALKDLSSLYDLVGGNQPVGNMESQPGGTPFDLGPDSTLQQNSLPNIPVDSPYQDLDGLQGPQFQKGIDAASQAHISSLSSVPGGSSNSPFQDRGDGGTPTQYLDNLPN